jgi:hypothetical protein
MEPSIYIILPVKVMINFMRMLHLRQTGITQSRIILEQPVIFMMVQLRLMRPIPEVI